MKDILRSHQYQKRLKMLLHVVLRASARRTSSENNTTYRSKLKRSVFPNLRLPAFKKSHLLFPSDNPNCALTSSPIFGVAQRREQSKHSARWWRASFGASPYRLSLASRCQSRAGARWALPTPRIVRRKLSGRHRGYHCSWRLRVENGASDLGEEPSHSPNFLEGRAPRRTLRRRSKWQLLYPFMRRSTF